jgi:hypothetical protein
MTKYWEIIADNLKNAGWNCGCISSTDHEGRQFWVVAAERDAKRFVVHAHNMSTAFLELQAAIHRQIESNPKSGRQLAPGCIRCRQVPADATQF